MADTFDAVVIGGGPGGYNAAIRLGQLGLTAACIDKRGVFGGTCLNVGCIPSKALLHASERLHEAETDFAKLGIKAKVELDLPAMMAQKTKVVGELTKGVEFLFKKNKVEGIVGEGRIVSAPLQGSLGQIEVKTPDGKTRTITAKNIIIASGSDIAPLPGVTIDEKQIVSSTGALSLAAVPKKLLVVGAGVIGLELGSVWKRLGSEVHVVEFLDRVTPGVDLEVAAAGNTEVVRAKLKTMRQLGLNDVIDDMLITLGKQYHIIRPVSRKEGVFVYYVLDKSKSNLALARRKAQDVERELTV